MLQRAGANIYENRRHKLLRIVSQTKARLKTNILIAQNPRGRSSPKLVN